MERAYRIAVGYDASKEAELALDWAISRAEHTGGSLTIVRAVQSDLALGALRAPGGEAANLAAHTLELPGVKKAQERLGEQNVEVSTAVGNPAAALIEASHRSDLVVVGTRGHGAIVSGLIGSTSYAVAGHCSCPVVVVRTEKDADVAPLPGEGAPIVVGVEDLETSRKLLDVAAAYADDYEAKVCLVRASYYVPVAAMTAEAAIASTDLIETLDAADQKILDECAGYLADQFPQLEVETVHESGDPARVLLGAADDAGLLVVGSRGHGGFTGLLLGSVSHAVIHQAKSPVVVVR